MSYEPFGIQNIKSLLNDHGLYLSKDRGQNYLIHRVSAEKIVNTLPDLTSEQTYFEVGTGLGALTVILAERGKTISMEIDKGVFELVHKKFNHLNLTHIHGDFLNWKDYPTHGEYIFISNLPYSISGEAIKHIIEQPIFHTGVLMLQKEFADRMESRAGSANYGPLSVIVQNFLTIEKLFFVGKGNFFPEPKIDSLVIRITKKKDRSGSKIFCSIYQNLFSCKKKNSYKQSCT
ncbi:MAG: ribosomal RNA small subunit methyltransferase A [Brevinema sp.]